MSPTTREKAFDVTGGDVRTPVSVQHNVSSVENLDGTACDFFQSIHHGVMYAVAPPWTQNSGVNQKQSDPGPRRSAAPAEEIMDGAEGGGRPRRIASTSTPDVAFPHEPRELKRKKWRKKSSSCFTSDLQAAFILSCAKDGLMLSLAVHSPRFHFLTRAERPLKVIKPFNVFLLCPQTEGSR